MSILLSQSSNEEAIQQELTEENHMCNQCNKSFTQKFSLDLHLLIHSMEKPNKCKKCNFSTNQARKLKTHMFIHNAKKLNYCDQCKRCFRRVDHLRSHMLTHTDKNRKCTLCDYSARTPQALRTHMCQFLQGGKNPCFVSLFFFTESLRVAKPCKIKLIFRLILVDWVLCIVKTS